MLIDTNIIIYAAKPEGFQARRYLSRIERMISVISYIESFGYQNLSAPERQRLEGIFRRSEILPLSFDVAEQAADLRQQRRMGLGDAIIAATAIVHNLALVTHNTEDFRWIAGLELLDPISNYP